MRHSITQEDGMGCGVACVAFVAGITYSQAVQKLGKEKAKTIGFHLKELADVLSVYNFTYKCRHANSTSRSEQLSDGTIVFIRRSRRYPYGHYLVRHEDKWMDPWINLIIDSNLARAKSGYRYRLPGQAQWVVLPNN